MPMRRKLAFVISNMSVGGAQKVVIDLIKGVDQSKFEVKLFVHHGQCGNHFEDEILQLQIPVKYVVPANGSFLHNYRALGRALKEYSPDVLHIHLDTLFAPLWAWVHRRRALFTVHSQPYRTFNKKFLIIMHRFLSKSRRYQITAVSDAIGRETEQLLMLPKDSVRVVYNPVDVLEKIQRTNKHQVKFVNVARFNPIKNHRLLIKAFAQVCKEADCVSLTLAGDGELIEVCRLYAQELGIEQKVHFLGDVQDVPGLLKEQDVFVLSSDSEALPISILEAMASGLPIVATNVGGVSDIVKKNGILVPKRDAEGLSRAMLRMIRSPEERIQMGELSYDRVQCFRTEAIAAQYEALYVQ